MVKTADMGDKAYRTISEVAELLDLQQHVLRFWETKFPQIKPMKRGGNRRYYRPDDIRLLKALKILLHKDGYTIRGAQKLFKEQGVKATIDACMGDGPVEQVPKIAPPVSRISSQKKMDASKDSVQQGPVLPIANTMITDTADADNRPDAEIDKKALQDIIRELKAISVLLSA